MQRRVRPAQCIVSQDDFKATMTMRKGKSVKNDFAILIQLRSPINTPSLNAHGSMNYFSPRITFPIFYFID